MPDTRLADRLLAEWVRRREEAAGHPADCAAADQLAVARGGDLAQRIVTRARALPGSAAAAATIRRLLRAAVAVGAVLVLAATLAGIAAASTALGASQPASLPLVLLIVVGANLLMLLAWLLLQAAGRRIAPGIGSLLRALSSAYVRRVATTAQTDAGTILRSITDGGLGRWYAASVVHAAWLGFALGAALTLAVLLSVRAYTLSWETTLLDDDALVTWARAFSIGPALFGVAGADTLPVVDATRASQAWSLWLLVASIVYGVLPRVLALMLSVLMLWHRRRGLVRDLGRPGFARLRTRLLPDHTVLGVVDPAPASSPPSPAAATPALAPAPLRGHVHGLALEDAAAGAPPTLPDVRWTWLGSVDDAASREAALRQLRAAAVDALAIRVRATLTPDRGIERFVAELAAAAAAPTSLLLDGLDRLRTRGEDGFAQRIDDWRQLGRRVGASVQLLDLAQ